MAQTAQSALRSDALRVLLAQLAILFTCRHHPCLVLAGVRPYAAEGGKLTVIWPAVDAIKRQIPLLEYLQTQSWEPARRISRGADGIVPAAPRSQAQLPGGPG